MNTRSLVDAGASLSHIIQALETIRGIQDEWQLTVQKVQKGKGKISACKVNIQTKHEKHAPHRNLYDIQKLIQESDLSHVIQEQSMKIFELLAVAEAKVHGTVLDKIHFHEVGAIDSIIDVVGTVVALQQLKIDRVYASALPLGQGTVHTAHGVLPVRGNQLIL